MKKLIFVVILLCGLSAVKSFAEEATKERKPATSTKAPNKSKKVKEPIAVTEAMLIEIGEENEQLANGSYGTGTYVMPSGGKWSQKDFQAAAKENFSDWRKRMKGTDCGKGRQLRSRMKIIAAMGKEEYSSDPKTQAKLTKLMEGHAIAAAFGTVWDGSGDGAEACPVYYFDFYTTNGLRLTLHYDQGD